MNYKLTRAHPWSEYEELRRKLQKKARKKTKQSFAQKQFITSTDCPQAGVNHHERSHTKRMKSFLPAATTESRAGERKVELNWHMRKGSEREGSELNPIQLYNLISYVN